MVNLVTAFIAAGVVALFQNTLSAWVALAIFMPVVPGMGGNSATQTLTVVVRGLALGELTWANSRKALIKELLVGIGNGAATGFVAALIAWLMIGQPSVGVLLFLAMIINLFVAGAAGTLIPLGLKALKIDPALASTVFITTFTDVCGFAAFLGLATLYLRSAHA
jgi:magnesium transporter